MTSTYYNGRLGNQIIRNLAVSLIAEKHNLRVDYCNNEVISDLGINLFSGTNTFNDTIILDDDNYFSVYNSTSLTHNLDPNNRNQKSAKYRNIALKSPGFLHSDTISS
jgi:hypothetical protein